MERIVKYVWDYANNGDPIVCYQLQNKNGVTIEVLSYGGIIHSWKVPMQGGETRDIVLGCDTMEAYEKQNAYMGAIVGRVANRIANGVFSLGDEIYQLPINDNPNSNHGGKKGFDKKVWSAEFLNGWLVLTYHSQDGEEGYPGNLSVSVSYHLAEDNCLHIMYRANTDKTTIINLTNHTYFNLHGQKKKTKILDHYLWLRSNQFTENDSNGLATGEVIDVSHTPYDFTVKSMIDSRISSSAPSIALCNGYDRNYILKKKHTSEILLAALIEADGLRLTCQTDQPGIQLYTGNFLSGELGKNGLVYNTHTGLCLETQDWPDAIHHKGFPSIILEPGQLYKRYTIYQISHI